VLSTAGGAFCTTTEASPYGPAPSSSCGVTRTVQVLTILGPTFDFGRARPIVGATINPSVFLQTSRYVTTGVELGYRVQEGDRSIGTILPQVHLNPTPSVKVQLGAGVSILVGKEARPLVALRVSYEL
jgi:hypothetical protein